MGVDLQTPPLPTATESLVDTSSGAENTDLATDLSRRTDKTSYSIPEDGKSVTVPTGQTRFKKTALGNYKSPSSFLIEYHLPNGPAEPASKKPTIRVRVSPNAKRLKSTGDIGPAEPHHTLRSGPNALRASSATYSPTTHDCMSATASEDIELARLNSAEQGIMSNRSYPPASHPETAEMVLGSEVSSMPADSMLEGPVKFDSPKKKQPVSKSSEYRVSEEKSGNLKPPIIERSRSKSKERITRKAIEKLQREQSPEGTYSKLRSHKTSDRTDSRDFAENELKPRSRRSSKSYRESGTESSLLPPRDGESNVSGASKVSLNNPRLLQTIEDSIRRIILPEIETIKRRQSIRSSGTKDSFLSESSTSRTDAGRRSHRVSTEKSGSGYVHDDDDSGKSHSGEAHRRKKKRHRSSRTTGTSDKSHSRRESLDSVAEEKQRIRKQKDKAILKDSKGSDDGKQELTRAALKSHDSRSSVNSSDASRKEKKRHHTKIRDREEQKHENKRDIPPMPMNSEIQDSDLTRESLLSAETTDSRRESDMMHITSPRILDASTNRNARESPSTTRSPLSLSTERPHESRSVRNDSPRAVRSKAERTLASPRSDRSLSSSKTRSAVLAGAGLGGAAGAMYGHHGKSKDHEKRPRSRNTNRSQSRDISPAPSTAGSRHSSAEHRKDAEAMTAHVQAGEREVESRVQHKGISLESVKSAKSADYPVTSKRHQGINLENEQEVVEEQDDSHIGVQQEDSEDFFEQQHALNDQYRSSAEFDSQGDPIDRSPEDTGYSPGQSLGTPSFGKVVEGKEVQGVGANPQFVHGPQQAESAVASLLNPSTVSTQSTRSAHLTHKPDVPSLSGTRDVQENESERFERGSWLGQHENSSAERWNAIRGHAQRLSNSSPEKLSATSPSDKSDGQVVMGASAIPVADDHIPEIGHGIDQHSEDGTNRSLDRKQSSILEGPLGDQSENREHWPYEPTPDSQKHGGYNQDEQYISAGNASLMGAAAGAAAGLGIGGMGTNQGTASRSQPSLRKEGSQSSTDSYGYQPGSMGGDDQFFNRQDLRDPSPGNMKDEGYVSAAHQDNSSPLSFSKPPPRLFDGSSRQPQYDRPAVGNDVFTNGKRASGVSAASQGVQSEGYDAAMGTGINNIESKDVVALMDHLTVRDGQRNARDTEILVTLVRSAAEMRNSFDDMKRFVETQNKFNISQSDQHAERTANKILNGSRLGALRSTSSSDREELPTRKKSIFRRALSGLGSRNEKDITRIEEMLMQLLDEVEGLRDAQSASVSQRGGPMSHAQPSLDSYERLRAAPSSGYEPEGQAGTSSTPNQSGNLSSHSPFSRSTQRMHSGYEVRKSSSKRISTVPEEDDVVDDPRHENNDGMMTPTQEAQKQRSVSYETPPSASRRPMSNQFTPTTLRSGDDKSRQKSAGSSLFNGIPKMSRWSKTTSSSAPQDRSSFQQDRPYSDSSRSGSSINVLPEGEGMYVRNDDDRLRSAHSLSRENERSPSPLIPDECHPSMMEDPKYRANRQSLTLQHPQPRQGSTNRHRSHLETQAQAYIGAPASRSVNSLNSDGGNPGEDAFGSAPALANKWYPKRQSQGNTYQTKPHGTSYHSPASSEGGYRRKTKDDGPLVPHAQYTDPQRDSIHTESSADRNSLADSLEQERSINSWEDTSEGSSAGDDRFRRGSGGSAREDGNDYYPEEEGYFDDAELDSDGNYNPIPAPRKRSPYTPGGLLAPIEEERYSIEQGRSEKARSVVSEPLGGEEERHRRDSREVRDSHEYNAAASGAAGRHNDMSDVEEDGESEEEDDDRATTPTLSPRAALGPVTTHSAEAGRVVSGASRKITGPREMPGRVGSGGQRTVSGGSGRVASGSSDGSAAPAEGAGLRGTIRRKPGPADY